ncbi:hypothetical protein BCR32DRAFT_281736 [Anaeromyces robustus]|uniref:Uncharacterized protein n=1 Tax=Anaeromyces robustus TaxID=1754192 RepID=A0A1Y1WZY4_9FUNG|nr:hypothetical protein BCR32DRAFT_281736 [Anaeromyces robustus]|eukprot:ORX79033.1 hypothetical protein BCR32DRAFT_281736 [Anaeromyces robustus]
MENKKEKNEFLDIKDPRASLESLRITKEAQKPKIVRVEQSSLLERARLFLPQIAEANSKLANQPKDKINIENVDNSQNGIIKMDLGLGVFDCVDPESSNSNPILPKKNDILETQKNLDLNIMLNPSELPDDYTKPLIQMLSTDESTDTSSSDTDLDTDLDSNSSNSDSSTDSSSDTSSDSENDSNSSSSDDDDDESMDIENKKNLNTKDIIMKDANMNESDNEDVKMEN